MAVELLELARLLQGIGASSHWACSLLSGYLVGGHLAGCRFLATSPTGREGVWERPSTTSGRGTAGAAAGARVGCRSVSPATSTHARAAYSEHRTQQTFQQLFERDHRQQQWRQRGERDDPQLKDRLLRERHEPHGPDHLETVRQIGKRLDVGAAHERFGRVAAAAQPLRVELSDVALREHAVFAEARCAWRVRAVPQTP